MKKILWATAHIVYGGISAKPKVYVFLETLNLNRKYCGFLPATNHMRETLPAI